MKERIDGQHPFKRKSKQFRFSQVNDIDLNLIALHPLIYFQLGPPN